MKKHQFDCLIDLLNISFHRIFCPIILTLGIYMYMYVQQYRNSQIMGKIPSDFSILEYSWFFITHSQDFPISVTSLLICLSSNFPSIGKIPQLFPKTGMKLVFHLNFPIISVSVNIILCAFPENSQVQGVRKPNDFPHL